MDDETVAKPPMTKEELLQKLRALQGPNDPEGAHGVADALLLDFIGDPEVTEAFDAIDKWYS